MLHPVRNNLHHRHIAFLPQPHPRALLVTPKRQPAPLLDDKALGPQEDEERIGMIIPYFIFMHPSLPTIPIYNAITICRNKRGE